MPLRRGFAALPRAELRSRSLQRPSSFQTQVESILAKPNYRHQKKQKEQARKLRQAEKQNRRQAARVDGDGTVVTDDAAPPAAVAPAQAET